MSSHDMPSSPRPIEDTTSTQDVPAVESVESNEKESKLKKFRSSVENYLGWMNSLIADNRPKLEAATKKRGMVFTKYKTGRPGGRWQTVEDYRKSTAAKGWQRLDQIPEEDEFTKMSGIIDRLEREVAFAQNLIDNWGKVEEWAQSQVESGYEIAYHNPNEEVWEQLAKQFGLNENYGSDATRMMRTALTEDLNEIVSGKPSELDPDGEIGY